MAVRRSKITKEFSERKRKMHWIAVNGEK